MKVTGTYFVRIMGLRKLNFIAGSRKAQLTTFVFMSVLKSHCLLPKIAMVFFLPQQQHPVSLVFLELVPS